MSVLYAPKFKSGQAWMTMARTSIDNGSHGPQKSDIPGEETSTIGVRFCMLSNGEVHVSEVSLPGKEREKRNLYAHVPCSRLRV